MPDQDQIAQQQQLLETHRQALAHYLGQLAMLGSAYVPHGVIHGIREAREGIKHVKAALRGWGIPFEDLPDDKELVGESGANMLAPVQVRMEALIPLMQVGEARDAVTVYRATFKSACHQIATLAGYKALHDLLQQLDDHLAILTRCCKGLLSGLATWDDLEINEPLLYAKIDELLEFSSQSLFVAEAVIWTPKLSRAQRDLRIALESFHIDRLRNALGRVKEVVSRQLSRINTRLVGVAETLRLATLVEALRQISGRLAQLSLNKGRSDQLNDFRQGIEDVATLDEQLRRTVALHNAFQEFDDELRRVEGLLEHDLDDLVDAWQDLGPMTRALCARDVAKWARQLDILGNDLERALAIGNPLQLRRAYNRYRSYATVCFNRVDQDLRDLCTALQQIGTPLDQALRMVQ